MRQLSDGGARRADSQDGDMARIGIRTHLGFLSIALALQVNAAHALESVDGPRANSEGVSIVADEASEEASISSDRSGLESEATGPPMAGPAMPAPGGEVNATGSAKALQERDASAVSNAQPEPEQASTGADSGETAKAKNENEALESVGSESLALGMPTRETLALGTPGQEGNQSWSAGWLIQTAGALVLVVGLILGLRAVLQKYAGRSGGLGLQLTAGGRAPSGVLEVLGRFPVGRGQTLVLLRVDRRVLLLSQNSSGFNTLCEIDDEDDVASLLIKTRDEEGESMVSRFNELLRGAERRDVWQEEVGRGPSSPRLAMLRDEAGGLPSETEVDSEEAGQESGEDALRRRLNLLRELRA